MSGLGVSGLRGLGFRAATLLKAPDVIARGSLVRGLRALGFGLRA